jgi:hypothetical protein
MGLFSIFNPKKKESYEKLYRVKVEPVSEEEAKQINSNEIIIKEKSQ